MNQFRIAWLLNSGFFYWHPTFSEFARLFPQTTIFVSTWKGYAPGLEDSFNVELVSGQKGFQITDPSKGYGLYFTYLPLNIINRLLKFKPDLIFSNSFGVWTILALLFKPVGKWRVVIAYEGSSPEVDWRNSPPRLAVRRAMVKAADACITNSQAGKSYLIEILKAKADRVFAKPYEVPDCNILLKGSESCEFNFSELQQPIFLFVGSIEPRKGINFLLEACAILEKQNVHNYTLLVIGEGPQREEMEDLSRSLNLTERVKWLGRIPYTQLGRFFQAADVFVLPTLEDTWGVVISEAMLFGKPVLCSKGAGSREIIVEGENGYIFDPCDPEKLAEIMKHFINDPSLISSMGDKSEQLIEQYTPKAAAEFLAKVTSLVLKHLYSD